MIEAVNGAIVTVVVFGVWLAFLWVVGVFDS